MELIKNLRKNLRKYSAFESTMLYCEQCNRMLPIELKGFSFIEPGLEMELSYKIDEILDFLLTIHYEKCGEKTLSHIDSVSIIRKPKNRDDSFRIYTGFKYHQYYGNKFKVVVKTCCFDDGSEDKEEKFIHGCIYVNVFPNKIKQD